MALWTFEWKKLFKSRLFLLYLGILCVLPVLLFSFNHYQTGVVREELTASFQRAKETTTQNSANLKGFFQDEELPVAYQEVQELLQEIDQRLQQVTSDVREARAELTADWFRLSKTTGAFNQLVQEQSLNLMIPYSGNIADEELARKLAFLAQHALQYEDDTYSVNQPNFLFSSGKLIFSWAGILLLALLVCLPLVVDWLQGTLKLWYVELTGPGRRRRIMSLLLFQNSLYLFLMVMIFAGLMLLMLVFQRGLFFSQRNSLSYPIYFSDGRVYTIADQLGLWFGVYVPLVLLLVKSGLLVISRFRKYRVGFVVTLVINGLLTWASGHDQRLWSFLNPWFYLSTASPFQQLHLLPSQVLVAAGCFWGLVILCDWLVAVSVKINV